MSIVWLAEEDDSGAVRTLHKAAWWVGRWLVWCAWSNWEKEVSQGGPALPKDELKMNRPHTMCG